MIQDEGREEIRILLPDAGLPEQYDGLRRGEIHHFDTAGEHRIGQAGQGGTGGGQIAQQAVQQGAQLIRRDVAHSRDVNAVTRQRACMGGKQIVAGQGADRIDRAIQRGPIGMIAIDKRGEAARGDALRVLLIRPKTGQHLPPHPFDGLHIKARRDQRLAQQVDGSIPVLGQELHRDRQRIIRHRIAERGRQTVACAGKGTGIHLAGTFFQ